VKLPRWVTLTAAAVLVAGGAAGVTYALWGGGAGTPAGVVRSGNLDLALDGYPTWVESGGGGHSGTLGSTLVVDHVSTPGDTLTITQPFHITLEGDNLAARLTVRWDSAPALTSGLMTASYVVNPPAGSGLTASASTALGTAVTLPGSPANLTPTTTNLTGTWTLVVTLTWTGTDVVVPASGVASAPTLSTGDIVIELNQVRDGNGFS
jgi:alternate signal-mediated exported protein